MKASCDVGWVLIDQIDHKSTIVTNVTSILSLLSFVPAAHSITAPTTNIKRLTAVLSFANSIGDQSAGSFANPGGRDAIM